MTEHEQPDPLPPDLAALFAKERAGYGEYAATQDAEYERIIERLALVAPPVNEGGGAPRASAPAAATKAVVSVKVAALVAATALTVGVLAGRATVAVAPAPPQPASASASAASTAPTLPQPASAAPQLSGFAPTSSPSAARVLPLAATGTAVAQGTLAQERELVEGARAALTRGRPADALAATDRHAQLFPRGRLAEEREVVAITALASLGRVPEAEARRARFLRAYPESLLSPPSFSSGDGGSR